MDTEAEHSVERGLRRRRRCVLLAIAGVTVLVSGSLTAAAFIRSPAQPRSPAALTEPVMRKVLTRTVVVRGNVVAAGVVAVTPNPAPGTAPPVVTRLVKRPGDAVEPGDVVIEVAGRPLIALPGSVPAHRDLRPGDNGTDVAQLQVALRGLGYPGGDPSASFGPGTKAAITQLYRRLGYTVPSTGGRDDVGDLPVLRAAAQAVAQARQSLAKDEQRVTDARAALTAAQSARPPDPSAVDQAGAALAVAETGLRVAAGDLARAQQAQRLVIATTGALMPLSEFVFVPTFPATLGSLNGRLGRPVSAPLLTIDTGPLVVSAVLGHAEHDMVRTGQAVTLVAEQISESASGALAAVGPYRPATQNPSSFDVPLPVGYPITVAPVPALPVTWLGLNVRITIRTLSTPGPVLVVPVAALSAAADGAVSVTVVTGDRTRITVPVTAGLDASGLVEVTPVAGAHLQPGDRVMVTG